MTTFVVDTLTGMLRGGRLMKSLARLGNNLGIKVIIHYDTIAKRVGQHLGIKPAIKHMISNAVNFLNIKEHKVKRLYIMQANADQNYIDELNNELCKQLNVQKVENKDIYLLPSVIVIHTLKNCVGIFIEVE